MADGTIAAAAADHGHKLERALNAEVTALSLACGALFPLLGYDGVMALVAREVKGSGALTHALHLTRDDMVVQKIRRHDHVPARLTPIDQDYEHLRTDMATLLRHLGIQPGPALRSVAYSGRRSRTWQRDLPASA